MNKKVKNIIMYVVGVIMAFSIFMFLMDVLTWNDKAPFDQNAATPTFFDLMFGTGGSRAAGFNYTQVTGMLIIFIIQIVIIVSVLVLIVLTLSKKINIKTSYTLLAIIGLFAIANATLTFCSPKFTINVWVIEGHISVNIAEYTKLFYGGLVYGITMAVSGIIAMIPCLATCCTKRKKKK